MATMRPHTTRLLYDLNEIRTELTQTVHELGTEAFQWSPRPDMNTCKTMLQEIGSMEALSRRLASHSELLDWDTVWQSLDKNDLESLLAALETLRAETREYLENTTEEQLETPIPLSQEWQGYFGGITEIEPEELLRWIIRHEYYHVGQLNTYVFLRAADKPAEDENTEDPTATS